MQHSTKHEETKKEPNNQVERCMPRKQKTGKIPFDTAAAAGAQVCCNVLLQESRMQLTMVCCAGTAATITALGDA
jgi:hypothetical protein